MLRNCTSRNEGMRLGILFKTSDLRSGNLAVTRMDIEFLNQLRRLMLYPTELRAVCVFAVVPTNKLRSAPHFQNALSYYRRVISQSLPVSRLHCPAALTGTYPARMSSAPVAILFVRFSQLQRWPARHVYISFDIT